MRAPAVSVIIPVYNTERYLAQCLTSVLEQTFTDLEILLLNDGSTDDSLAIMHMFARQDERIRLIDKTNEGYGASCNRGIREARGEWIAIVEPDDWIEAHMLERMLGFAARFEESQTAPEIIKTPYWRIWMADTKEQRKLNCGYRKRVKPAQQPFMIADAPELLVHHPSIWSALYRRSFLNEHGIRFSEYPGAGWADNPFLVDTLCRAQRIVYLDEPFYCYREDTPEKRAQFAQRSPLLPLQRWQTMMDILEQLGVTDERILQAHYCRGCNYLEEILKQVSLENTKVRAEVITLFERMDPTLMLNDLRIAPAHKILFCELRDLPVSSVNTKGYRMHRIRERLYYVRNLGIGYTLSQTMRHIKKRF